MADMPAELNSVVVHNAGTNPMLWRRFFNGTDGPILELLLGFLDGPSLGRAMALNKRFQLLAAKNSLWVDLLTHQKALRRAEVDGDRDQVSLLEHEEFGPLFLAQSSS